MTATERRDVLADVIEAFAGDIGLHWQALADRLAERWPERYGDTSADAVSAECRARGVRSVAVRMDGDVAKGCRLADVETAAAGS